LNDGQGNFKELSPEQFPSAFPDSTSSLGATESEIRDSVGAILPRYESAALKPVAHQDALYLARLQIPDSFYFSCISRSFSLGRAPPILLSSL